MIRLWIFLFLATLLICFGCTESNSRKMQSKEMIDWDSVFVHQGLQNVASVDSSIIVDLRYSGSNNFIGKDLYGGLEEAYLRPEALEKLSLASKKLQNQNPDLRFYIYDAARPRRVQQILWDQSGLPEDERTKYVANPASGSIHNYGFAVDLTISDTNGNELNMGTDYDHFTEKAHIDKEEELIQNGILTEEQVQNRILLRNVMTESGFIPIRSEWWHFDAIPRDSVTSNYNIVE